MMLKKLKKADKEISDGEDAEMSFLDHLEELRWHVIRALVAIFSCAIVVYIFEGWIFENIIFAHKDPSFITYDIFSRIGVDFSPASFEIIQTEMAEQFFTSLKVSFWIGLIVSFPYVFYQFWKFIKPGLYSNEQKVTRGVVFICSSLFLLGVAFGFVIMAPFAIRFLTGYSVGVAVNNSTSLSSYVGYLTMFTIPTGIVFQMPLLVFFLAKVGLVTADTMREYRKHSMVVILILSAVITPPDPITMFLIGVPIYFLYEISIFIAGRTAKKRQALLDK